jgi:aspartate dehydrogenase
MADSSKSVRADLRVAIVGLGPIGKRVAEALDRGIDGLALAAVSARNPEKHRGWLSGLTRTPVVLPIDALCEVADIVIECAPGKLVRSIVEPFVTSGKTAVVLSAGALLDHEDLIELAKRNGGQIVVPTGALIGLDAVTAAAVGTIHSVRMVTRKPIAGLALHHREQHRYRANYRAAQDIRWYGAGGGKRIPGESECCGRAVAGRDRP